MGLLENHPAVEAIQPGADFSVFSLDTVEVTRTAHLNVTCRVPGNDVRPTWFRLPPLVHDQIPRGYWFASGDEVHQPMPGNPWPAPDCHGFTMPHFVLAGLGADDGWAEFTHPRFVVDLTGDGRGDIVGFGDDGVWVALNDGAGGFAAPVLRLGAFAPNQGGWTAERHPRVVADLTANGHRDIVGFGDDGVWTAFGDGAGGFGAPAYALADLGVNQGWQVGRHPRFVEDLTGDGCADLIGFGDAGVWVALNNGAGGFLPPARVVDEFAVEQGWKVQLHPRMLADLTGDGRPDIVGFADDGVYVAINDGAGGFGPAQKRLDDFGIVQEWDPASHPRLVADVTGDGRADIVGFGDNGVHISLNDGAGGFGEPSRVVPFFGANGPLVVWNYWTPRLLVDLTGNGAADIVGFGDEGVWVAILDTAGPTSPQFVVPDYGFDTGWRNGHLRIAADLTGDGRADLVGFGDAGVYVCYNQGTGPFPRPVVTT